MPQPVPEYVYKIVTAPLWRAAAGRSEIPPMPIDEQDGFLHLSTAAQLAGTLSLHFKGQSGLELLAIKSDAIPDLRWEPSRGGQLFPHAYGAVPQAAIAWTDQVSVGEDGATSLPDRVR